MTKKAHDTSGWEPPACAWCGWTNDGCECEFARQLEVCNGCEAHYWENSEPGWICDAPQGWIDDHQRNNKIQAYVRSLPALPTSMRASLDGWTFQISPFGGFYNVQKDGGES